MTRPLRDTDEPTPRAYEALAAIEAAGSTGVTYQQLRGLLGVSIDTCRTWVVCLESRGMVHAREGKEQRGRARQKTWLAGPDPAGPRTNALLERALPSIFHAGMM